jgi:very-short-patch-repair endonuclease
VAAISHLTAAAVWRMRDRSPATIDVATLAASHSRPGIRVHRTLTLDDLTHHRGLPITSPARTLADSTSLLDDDELLRACGEATYLGLIEAGATGPPRLRGALAKLSTTGPQRTKSQLEDRLLALVARHDLPPPLVNVPLHGYTVDFLWPDRKLIVETDGRNHLRPHVYEADRLRDADLQDHGYRVYRVTAKELDEHPDRVVRRLA